MSKKNKKTKGKIIPEQFEKLIDKRQILTPEELDDFLVIGDENNSIQETIDSQPKYKGLDKDTIKALLEVVENEASNLDSNYYDKRQIILYDFKRPNIFTKNQLRYMKKLQTLFCDDLSLKLSNIFKEFVELQLHCVDQCTYGEYLMTLPSLYGKHLKQPISFNNYSGLFILEINPPIAIAMIEKLFGNVEYFQKSNLERPNMIISKFDRNIINELIEDTFFDSWKKTFNWFETDFKLLESNKEVIGVKDIVMEIVIELIIGEESGMINIAYPLKFNEKLFTDIENLYNLEN